MRDSVKLAGQHRRFEGSRLSVVAGVKQQNEWDFHRLERIDQFTRINGVLRKLFDVQSLHWTPIYKIAGDRKMIPRDAFGDTVTSEVHNQQRLRRTSGFYLAGDSLQCGVEVPFVR